MNGSRLVTTGAIIFLLLSLAGFGVEARAENAGKYQSDRESVIFDAVISQNGIRELPIVRASLSQSFHNDMDRIIDILNPILFDPDIELEVIREEWNGDALLVKYYATREYKDAGDPNYIFYDGTVGSNTLDWEIYASAVENPSQIDSFRENRLSCPDLSFSMAKDVVASVATLVKEIGFSNTSLYMMNAYSPDMQTDPASGAMRYTGLETLRNAIEDIGSESYVLTFRFRYFDIPCSSYMHYLPTMDAYTISPNLFVLWNQNGVIQFFAHEMLDPINSSEPYELIDFHQAIDVVLERKGQLLGVDPAVCKEIALEYVPIPYVGCDMEREADLTPVWVFYLERNHSGGREVESVMVNAITGMIIE